MKKQLVVCGGGSSAHTLIPFLKDSIFDVSLLTSRPEKWHNQVDLEWHDPSGRVMGCYSGELRKASSNPKELIPDADYIVFCMPVHQYRVCLKEIAPYINRNKTVCIGTVYGQAGFDWMVDEVVRQKLSYKEFSGYVIHLLVSADPARRSRKVLRDLEKAVIDLHIIKLGESLSVQFRSRADQLRLNLPAKYLFPYLFVSHFIAYCVY